jgi:hypothetical protein
MTNGQGGHDRNQQYDGIWKKRTALTGCAWLPRPCLDRKLPNLWFFVGLVDLLLFLFRIDGRLIRAGC